MELLKGESPYQRLQRERRLSEPDTIRLGRQVAAALAAAHAKEVIHRDLKHENICLVPDAEAAGGERAKILDFGIAKLAHGQTGLVRTHTNMVMGTPIYMSPEQCKGGKYVGERADVYALGVILFEMVSGRPPFIAEQAGEYIGMHLVMEPPSLGSLIPTTTQGLQRLVDSMLSKEPQQRPAMKVVTAILKSLGNISSDVISVRDLAADDLASGPTRWNLRALEEPTANLRSLPLRATAPAPSPALALPMEPVRVQVGTPPQVAAIPQSPIAAQSATDRDRIPYGRDPNGGLDEPTALMSSEKVSTLISHR